jgi:broad specificity phosphatase PhoE
MPAMNHLSCVDRLANRFSVMRHGQSTANARGVIVSCIDNDRRGDYGLTELGRQQALAAVRGCGLPAETVICSSDFSRARQTAEVVRAHLGAAEVGVAEALRERCFGDWEGTPTANYARVWAADAADAADAAVAAVAAGEASAGEGGAGEGGAGRADGGVEPAAAVLDRVTAFIVELERRYSGRDILLVSHGDTLQILQAGFLRMDPSGHRSLPHLATAEIRQLRLGEGGRSRP